MDDFNTFDFNEDAPDWRWSMVTAMYSNGQAPSRKADSWMRSCYRYLQRWHNYSIEDRLRLKQDYPFIYRAHQLNRDETSTKWIIEAALLTEISEDDIAEYVGVEVNAIREYARLFFDIRSKLAHEGYVLNQILIPSMSRGIHQRDYDFLYKSLAYCCGWENFKAFINQDVMPKEMEMYFQRSFKNGVLKAGFLATKRLDVNNFNAPEVIGLTLKLLEMEKANLTDADRTKTEKLLGDLINQCKLTIIPSKKAINNIEPRVSELLTGVPQLKYGDEIPVIKDNGA